MKTVSISLSCIMALLTLSSCQSMEGSWKNAQAERAELALARYRIDKLHYNTARMEGTIEAYEQFLASYPHSEYIGEAQSDLRRLHFNELLGSGDIKGILAFLKRYPTKEQEAVLKGLSPIGQPENETLNRIANIYFNEAQAQNTIEAYEGFLRLFPDAKMASEAHTRLETLLWTRATETDDEESYSTFLSAYPNSRHKDAAVKRIAQKQFVSHAKAGRIESVKRQINAVNVDLKSRALMMAVWGALHTSQKIRLDLGPKGEILGFPEMAEKRTASVDRAIYVEIIRLLMEAGADPGTYDYRNFDSVATKEYDHNKEFRERGAARTFYGVFGSDADLVRGGSGQSARWVAEIEKAKDILILLNRHVLPDISPLFSSWCIHYSRAHREILTIRARWQSAMICSIWLLTLATE